MSHVIRTNRATNPNLNSTATNWSSFSGTGGTASGARQNLAGWDGNLGFFRVTWTVATTAVSGGMVYLETTGGIVASTEYTQSLYVKPSVLQTLRVSAQYRDAANVNIGGTTFGASVICPANVWSRVSVTSTSPAGAVARVALTVGATTVGGGGVNWAIGDTLDVDASLIENGPVLGSYFDGSYVDASGAFFSWTGATDASTSEADTYVPELTLTVHTDLPTDRVEIDVIDLPPSSHTCTVWRTADGKRQAVRGTRRVEIVASDTFIDYEAPMYRLLTYELEILVGVGRGAPVQSKTTIVEPAGPLYGWIQDPLDPTASIKLYGDLVNGGETTLMDEALKRLEREADISMIKIMGSPDPVALLGQRMAQSGVSFALGTNAAQQAADLRNLLDQAPLILIRPVPDWSASLPGLCYIAPPMPVELPKNEAWGGNIIEWKFETSLVAAPTMAVVVATWTYGDVQALWNTYQEAQTALAGDTYLQVKKNPTG
jgi:hypothetical protein